MLEQAQEISDHEPKAANLEPVAENHEPVAENLEPKAENLLLSCMDFRMVQHVVGYMNGLGLKNGFDHVTLAGASLGAAVRHNPAWARTFWDHLDFAITEHHISKVMILDHRDCGTYKAVLGSDFAANPAVETMVHTEHLVELRREIGQRHPGIEVELLLMALDGSVETID